MIADDTKTQDPIEILLFSVRLGDLVTDNVRSSNKWKLAMFKAYYGDYLMVPSYWEDLPEDEKAKRLDQMADYLEKPVNVSVRTIKGGDS